MKFLLDVNALIALGHTAHVHHEKSMRWYRTLKGSKATLCTCAITELGFVRVAVQAGLQPEIVSARKALSALKSSGSIPFEILADGLGVEKLPALARTPAKPTDGHLPELARHHHAQLVTLDAGLPGASGLP